MCILRIVTVHVKFEINIEINLFGKLLNSVLNEITGKEDYKFNSKAIMVDENDANFCHI